MLRGTVFHARERGVGLPLRLQQA